MHFCRAAIAFETNDPKKSLHYKKKALDLQLEVSKRLDTVDIRLARSYHEYGIALIADGDYQSAIDHINISLEIDKSLGAYPYNWNTETNLGLAYTLKRDFQAADEVLVGTLQRRENIYGKDDKESFRYVHSYLLGHLTAHLDQVGFCTLWATCGRLKEDSRRVLTSTKDLLHLLRLR